MRDTDRIGNATLNTNQNIAAALARSGLSDNVHFLLWAAACLVVLGRDGLGDPAAAGSGGDSGPVLAPDLRGDVRPGGVAGVVVAPLGVDAADAGRHRRWSPTGASVMRRWRR